MDDITSRALVSDPETRRALQLDALSAILPMERRDRLAELLTDDDVATLKHLAQEGMGENSLRALASDLAYLEAWAQAAIGAALPWPASESLVLKFVAHHLWDPAKRETDPQHGMPCRRRGAATECRDAAQRRPACAVDGETAARKLGHLASLERAGGSVRLAEPALRAPARGPRQHTTAAAQEQAGGDARRSGPPARTCRTDRLADTRDLAILLLAFASGGRRRSEVARLRLEQLSDEPLVPFDPQDPNSPTLPCVAIQLGRTKTGKPTRRRGCCWSARRSRRCANGSSGRTSARGRSSARSTAGRRSRRRALTPQAINLIVKRRCALAGLEPREFSAHGLRSGYLTEAARRGVALPEAMQQSQHRSVQQASSFYNDAERRQGRAVRLGIPAGFAELSAYNSARAKPGRVGIWHVAGNPSNISLRTRKG